MATIHHNNRLRRPSDPKPEEIARLAAAIRAQKLAISPGNPPNGSYRPGIREIRAADVERSAARGF